MLQTKELKILACYEAGDKNAQSYVVFEQSTPVWKILSRQKEDALQGQVTISFVGIEPMCPGVAVINAGIDQAFKNDH